ncbi:MAG: phosphatase PAP2 family protein [Lachnospiraceae bacterium]|nr:phosphatase PAP2 family protein [Lachnospiraceae bacterium]MBR5993384.1 phosphatase PAP2 family protein [Lachnospiraceae bacterium]
MTKQKKNDLMAGITLFGVFLMWTIMVRCVDVKPVGQNGTDIGFAGINTWFHGLTGVHMWIYTVTDWLGLVPIAVCMCFGVLGLVQLINRKSLFKVDRDIIVLGIYYLIVIFAYLFFEMVPINYRPIPIEGIMEASYPSSTTLLVLSVMPTLMYQVRRRVKNKTMQTAIIYAGGLFAALMALGRTVAGVHWLTDIIGSILLSFGLFMLYRFFATGRSDKN